MTYEEIFNHDIDYWIEVLPRYQQNLIEELYEKEGSYENVANKWLRAFPSNTVPFGTETNKSLFFEKFLDEFELFVRGDEKYAEQKEELSKYSNCVNTVVVSMISSALALTLGVAATFIAPVVVITLGIIGKIGLNAWLSIREEERKNKQ